jgi:hypothetical protein
MVGLAGCRRTAVASFASAALCVVGMVGSFRDRQSHLVGPLGFDRRQGLDR